MTLCHSLKLVATTFIAGVAIPIDLVAAQEVTLTDILPDQSIANSGIMLIIFVGAFAFAMWSATWLIRERRMLDENNRRVELELADLKARHERAQALLDVPDQRVVIWENREDSPVCRGQLPENTNAPADPTQFIAFGTWMNAQSAQSFEHAVDRLRRLAESFDLTVETKSGTVVEVQGRASGSHAFVRFISLSGDRAALAALEAQHTRLMQTTDTMKSLLEAIPFPVWLRDQQSQLTWANQAYVDAVDGEDLDMVSEDNRHLLDENVRKQVTAAHNQELETAGGKISQIRERLPATISGDRRMMDVSEVFYTGGSAGLAVDMSEVEEVQSNLRRTLESHAQTMNQLATAVAIFDEKRHLVFYNSAFEDLWKLEPRFLDDEPDNGALFDALREAGKIAEQPDWSKWRNGLLEVYESTQPQEDWWHLPDRRTLRIIASPQKQGGVTWVFENITEQLEMESRYIALTQVQGETLDHLSEAIAVFAPDGRLKLSNPSFQKLWALDDEQVAANTPIADITELCSQSIDDPTVWKELSTGITGVSDARKTLSGRVTLGPDTILDYALVPLPNGQTLLSFADVSANVNLEHTLKERNEALEAAERLKNAFIEHVSYEFRAPLTNIKGFAEMLQQPAFGPLNEKQSEYVSHIAASSNVLHALVDNLLDLATVDAGIMELDLHQVEMRDTMRTAAKSVAELLHDKRVTLNLIPARQAAAQGQFVADANRVQQVLYNLLANAVTFSPEGSSITLESEIDQDSVAFVVSDLGPGIPKEQRASLFERFSSRAQGDGRKGAGLGLAIARSLVELHGGSLILDTTCTTGTRFICRFPKLPSSDTEPARQAAQ
ncbi:MAG: PAS domain-containing protein [Rhizobiaceae bacterium]|nr:PAS domain-containing protein [Rhizobiaceae bacterium]